MTPLLTLADAADRIFAGRMTSRLKPGLDDFPIIGVRDVGDSIGRVNQLEVAQGLSGADAQRVSVQAGDIVVTSRGAVRAAVVEAEHEGAIAGVNTVVVRPRSSSSSTVLAAYLRHPRTIETLLRDFSGSTVPGFSIETLRALPLDLPDEETLRQMEDMVMAAYRYHSAMTEAANARLTLALDLVAQNLAPSGHDA